MATTEETFCLIIGGGPVGLSLALDLGARGVPAILVNENLTTAEHPKCNYSNARTMEHFRRLGIASEVRQAGVDVKLPRAVSYRTRYCEHELGRIELTFLTTPEWPGPENPHSINQVHLEPILKRITEAQPSIDVRFGKQALDLTFDDDGAVASIEDVVTGMRSMIRARYVAGCDGSRSMVRRKIGAKFAGDDGSIVRNFVSGCMMAYFIRAPGLHEAAQSTPALMTWIVNHDARGYIMSQNGRDCFIVHYQAPPGVDWRTLSSEDVLARMLGRQAEYEILAASPWTGGLALVADNYAQGPAFVLGDAAHLYTPLGGFGMNTGIGDAMNLGWKLAAMHQGWGGEHLLASYDAERRPIGVRNSQIGVHCAARKDRWRIPADINEDTPAAEASRKRFGDFIAEDDRDEYATLGVQLGERYESQIIAPSDDTPPPDPWDRYVPSDSAGCRTPHFFLADGRSLYDALAPDFGIIAFGDADAAPIEAAAAERGLPLRVVRVAARDPQYRRDLVLVRPDGHIAWAANEAPADAFALIDRVRGALG